MGFLCDDLLKTSNAVYGEGVQHGSFVWSLNKLSGMEKKHNIDEKSAEMIPEPQRQAKNYKQEAAVKLRSCRLISKPIL